MRRALALALALPALGFVVVRDVGDDGPILWSDPTVTVELQADGSDDVSDGSDLAAIRAAIATWNAVPCSRFAFVEGPTGTSRAFGRDGVNRVTFLESDWPAYAMGAGAITVRERDEGTPDRWVEFDVLVNGQDARWATDGTVSRGDIQSAVAHELGHGLGLQHSSDPRATMFFSVGLGVTYARSLADDDVAGACFLYPVGAASCSDDGDCPLVYGQYGGGNYRSRCEANACVPGPAARYGAGCFEAADCASGVCLVDPLQPPASEAGFCSRACDAVGASCPDGDHCGDTPAGPRCVIGRVDCAVDADCGGMPRVCARQLDGRFECQRLCLRDLQCSTIPGAICHGGTGANPAGFCRVPGPKAAGEPCASGLECESLACTGGGAQTSCAPRLGRDAGVPRDAAPSADPDAALAREDAALAGDDAEPDAGVGGTRGSIVGGCACAASPTPTGRAGLSGLLALLLSTWRRGERLRARARQALGAAGSSSKPPSRAP